MQAISGDITVLYIAPFIAAVFLLGFVQQILEMRGVKLSQQRMQVVFGGICSVVGGGSFWWIFRRPRRSSLVLHERGFRFKQTIARFEDLKAIRFGRESSAVETMVASVNSLFGRFSRRNAMVAEMAEKAKAGSLTLIFRNGEIAYLKDLLFRVHPEDLGRFFERVRAMSPSLLVCPESEATN